MAKALVKKEDDYFEMEKKRAKTRKENMVLTQKNKELSERLIK